MRRAVAVDAGELVRLRGVMLAAMHGSAPEPGRWLDDAAATLRQRLGGEDASMAAFVVDSPDASGALAACAVGVIERRLGDPGNPSGDIGYVFNVSTDPAYRRRGYSRACMEALLGWFRECGVSTVDLRASAEGEPLYRALGFVPRTAMVTMRLTIDSTSERLRPTDGITTFPTLDVSSSPGE